jgi:6-phosphogluconate dehydrogenase
MPQLGFIGLGRMGASMVKRLADSGLSCVAFDVHAEAVKTAAQLPGVTGVASLEALVAALKPPRAIWLMVPAAVVDGEIAKLAPLLSAGDTLIDGGNSNYRDDIRRAAELRTRGIHYVDVGTSGGLAGGEQGYCLMMGGEQAAVDALSPVFAALAQKPEGASATGTAGRGYLHCGPHGAGHFVKMVHNGIEYGVMAAFAEGFNILHHANIGKRKHESDAETTPLAHPEYFQYDFDVAQIAELWRHGSVIRSWLLDLTARALAEDATLAGFAGRVSDSGEGRWTVAAAIEEGVPAPVITTSLFSRFESRGNADFADRLLSAMRKQFGGHVEKK